MVTRGATVPHSSFIIWVGEFKPSFQTFLLKFKNCPGSCRLVLGRLCLQTQISATQQICKSGYTWYIGCLDKSYYGWPEGILRCCIQPAVNKPTLTFYLFCCVCFLVICGFRCIIINIGGSSSSSAMPHRLRYPWILNSTPLETRIISLKLSLIISSLTLIRTHDVHRYKHHCFLLLSSYLLVRVSIYRLFFIVSH